MQPSSSYVVGRKFSEKTLFEACYRCQRFDLDLVSTKWRVGGHWSAFLTKSPLGRHLRKCRDGDKLGAVEGNEEQQLYGDRDNDNSAFTRERRSRVKATVAAVEVYVELPLFDVFGGDKFIAVSLSPMFTAAPLLSKPLTPSTHRLSLSNDLQIGNMLTLNGLRRGPRLARTGVWCVTYREECSMLFPLSPVAAELFVSGDGGLYELVLLASLAILVRRRHHQVFRRLAVNKHTAQELFSVAVARYAS